MAVIEFKDVNKKFKLYQNLSYSIKEIFINTMLRRWKKQIAYHPVLTDVSFRIEKGETVGIIGENGTGKSTTLKLISKILYADSGDVLVSGKVSALLEVGAGFQPDLTGRENVFLYGSILGLSKATITKKYDEIVAFAEMEEFMNSPVKNYSSGMYMRLAFAVAINVDPDILIIDEVLAVGDEAFQKKCIEKILSFKRQGKTIVFVSHDMGMVDRICDRVIFIKKGGHIVEGSTDDMINLYRRLVYNIVDEPEAVPEADTGKVKLMLHESHTHPMNNRYGSRKVEISRIYFSDVKGNIKNRFDTGEDIAVNVELKRNSEASEVVFGYAVHSEGDVLVSGSNSRNHHVTLKNSSDTSRFRLILGNVLLEGRYQFTAEIHSADQVDQYDILDRQYEFMVDQETADGMGLVKLPVSWEMLEEANLS